MLSWDWKAILILLGIVAIFVTIFSLISYYSSKSLAKWLKNVQTINKRKDLDRSPKLKEIVRIVREVSRINRINMPEVGIYPSDEINAFATGPAGNTLIALSSNLIKVMNIEEIRGVVAHELSHLIHNDVRRILLVQGTFDILYWMFYFLLWDLLSPPREKGEEESIIKWVFRRIIFEIIMGIFHLIGSLIVLWYNRKRELAADYRGAKIIGVDNMLAALRKLLILENKTWIVDGVDLTEDDNNQQDEPNSISLLKFNPKKKKRGLLELFRTHPRLEERIEKLEKLKKRWNSTKAA